MKVTLRPYHSMLHRLSVSENRRGSVFESVWDVDRLRVCRYPSRTRGAIYCERITEDFAREATSYY